MNSDWSQKSPEVKDIIRYCHNIEGFEREHYQAVLAMVITKENLFGFELKDESPADFAARYYSRALREQVPTTDPEYQLFENAHSKMVQWIIQSERESGTTQCFQWFLRGWITAVPVLCVLLFVVGYVVGLSFGGACANLEAAKAHSLALLERELPFCNFKRSALKCVLHDSCNVKQQEGLDFPEPPAVEWF